MKSFLLASFALLAACAAIAELPQERVNDGKQLAFDRNKGNCLACHAIDDGESPGNIGPPLAALKTRFKDKAQLRDQIFDATRFNPETSMPPFGRNRILTADEIDRIVDYLWSQP
ncbi:sulfur oxidation c-type cytochrome SoxX [Candidatus Methylomicrobium oryzae]|jgi:sulfur-oxidizing protein SoxX|uniref:sulfur oxidation c-type cytochrome SoxX n=1 Tax=Candidatus Methylomicrobium oryzae TaxID=2802053 RepID=UPI001922F112|nr:sulfur oxidation c-type cytochrome SoxX [Methylomicrobium sp. RS1]MBL1264188.1 sulfur oxidation c-type cytochrome SoxX [Methylomicrobium sp. RS1]